MSEFIYLRFPPLPLSRHDTAGDRPEAEEPASRFQVSEYAGVRRSSSAQRCRKRLEEAGQRQLSRPHFVQQIFGYLPRADQRRWAEAYLRGLQCTPGRKTVRQMAQTLDPGAPSAAQGLQQFISSSPWSWMSASARLAHHVAECLPTEAWVVGTVVAEKHGKHSVGVHRRFLPEAGRTLNCQVGLGLFLASGAECVPIAWQLVMDDTWFGEEQRARARIPESVCYQSASAQLLDIADWLAELRLHRSAPLVVDHPVGPDVGPLVDRLNERNWGFAIAVHPEQPVAAALGPQQAGDDRRAPGAEPGRTVPARTFMTRRTAQPPGTVTLRRHDAENRRFVLSAPVRLPGPRQARRTYLLVAEQPAGLQGTTRYWITNLHNRSLEEVATHLGRARPLRATVQALEEEFGLLDFQGRTFPGWHRHVTMASAAYAYQRLHAPAPSCQGQAGA
ncbi:transposase [Streptacidiphilus sp. 4-A2]|nr:transposase [Streptacidiphilus sp. 4-A2]